jgi:hypothetical protein
VEGDDGRWIAYIECCGGFIREEVGTYETRREARRAAKRAADEANGVMDGPGAIRPSSSVDPAHAVARPQRWSWAHGRRTDR